MGTNRLVDLHCHILPGLDDGSPSLDASIKMAKAAVADGVGYILATPHHLDRHYVNHASKVRLAVTTFQAELDRLGIHLRVFPGQEVHLNGEIMVNIDDLLGIDEGRKYLLLELPHEMVPRYLDEVIFQLLCEGITPVIAHPERNEQIMANPKILYDLTEQGSISQVTATSLVGIFGKRVQKTAIELVSCGLVHVVASDAHVFAKRNFVMRKAYKMLAEQDLSYPELFSNNARCLLNGTDITLPPVTIPHKVRKFIL
ncbi:tyrosine-protein phosphatase [Lactiplantibacillus daoliensis]|uniref:Tyrosine-protein phosphatase n=1 Tax=Lactiplantibacillus daoliensis TaxID=2559916 RepID=A0ABW1UFM8_9LACO